MNSGELKNHVLKFGYNQLTLKFSSRNVGEKMCNLSYQEVFKEKQDFELYLITRFGCKKLSYSNGLSGLC